MLHDTEERIRKILIELASQKTTISYGQLNSQAPLHLDLDMHSDKNYLDQLLGTVSEYEHRRDRPLLAALIINGKGTQKGKPDKMFFELAHELGSYKSDEDKTEWLKAEQERLYHEWKTGIVRD